MAEARRRPTHDEQGNPLGYRDGKYWVWYASNPKHYPRQRTVNGERGTLLPYTTGKFRRYDVGPRGGRALKECYHQTYWVNGRVCEIKSRKDSEDGDWYKAYVPVSGEIYNRYDPSESYALEGGVLVD